MAKSCSGCGHRATWVLSLQWRRISGATPKPVYAHNQPEPDYLCDECVELVAAGHPPQPRLPLGGATR